MGINYPLFYAVGREIAASLGAGLIRKIYQPGESDLRIRYWTGRGNIDLYVTADPASPSWFLAEELPANPPAPPRFCQLLRARLRRFLSLELLEGDRVAFLDHIGTSGELYRLVVELIPGSANLLLLDAGGRILDTLHRISPARGLRRGDVYSPPVAPGGMDLQSPWQGDDPSKVAREQHDHELGPLSGYGGRSELLALVAKERKRLVKRLAKIAAEEERSFEFERMRQLADLLAADLHRARRGMDHLLVTDYYADPPVELHIPLDPRKTPAENLQERYRQARKREMALEHITRRREETFEESAWLESVALAINEAVTDADLLPVWEEVGGVFGRKGEVRAEPKRVRVADAAGIRKGTTPGGFNIIWGTNNRSNDRVTLHERRRGDLWMHAQNAPGCHLILHTEGRQVPEDDLLYAASIAAGYSRYRDEGKADVMIAAVEEVKKPAKAPPGAVRVGRYRSVMVVPQRVEEA